MARHDLSRRDASSHAASELEYIIRREKFDAQPKVKKVSAEQAMRDKRVFETKSDRDVTRVLFVSQDTELLNPTQQSLDGYINISDLFDEVHILLLRPGILPKYPVLRVAHNVWVYTAAAPSWWQTPGAGIEMAEEQLEFAAGFRPDLIVARDPFESAVVAYRLGKKYGRPTQLHVLDDFSTKEFLEKDKRNFWRRFLLRFTVSRFQSVRTLTNKVKVLLEERSSIPDVAVLPKYQDYETLLESEATLDLKEKYRPFVFIMLYIGELGHESNLHHALDAARFALVNPRVGMVVLGEGPARAEFQKRAKQLKIERQVVFEPRVTDVVPYLKSANLMIVTDTDPDSEEVVLKGAAAGIPLVMAKTERREDIFTDGESAFLCEPGDVQEFTNEIDELLNDIELRREFSTRGQDIIRMQFHNDKEEYREAYRTSIERAFFVGTEDEQETEGS